MTAKEFHREQQKNLRAHKTRLFVVVVVPAFEWLIIPTYSKDFGFMDVKSIQILSRGFLEKWA